FPSHGPGQGGQCVVASPFENPFPRCRRAAIHSRTINAKFIHKPFRGDGRLDFSGGVARFPGVSCTTRMSAWWQYGLCTFGLKTKFPLRSWLFSCGTKLTSIGNAIKKSATTIPPAATKFKRGWKVASGELPQLRFAAGTVHVNSNQTGDRPQCHPDIQHGVI